MTENASLLLSPTTLGGVSLPNRIVVAPMCQYSAVDGCATDWHLVHLGQFALGGAGLVLAEATGVTPEGRISPHCLGLHTDAQEEALARIARFFKAQGMGRLGIQIGHAGRKASAAAPWLGGAPVGVGEGGWPVVSASAIPFGEGWPVPTALDGAGLERVREAFVAAGRRAVRAGIEVLELHMAHGYLMHQFLSPLSNHRDDAYGGSDEARMRFPLEVFAAVRAGVDAGVPIGVRISATDYVEGGWSVEQAVVFAKALTVAGAAYIHVSGGGLVADAKIPAAPGYQVGFARRVRAETGAPVIAVGLITRPEEAEAVLRRGDADLVALGRSMLADPRWPQHAARALGDEPAFPKQYGFAIGPGWRKAAEREWAEAAR